MNRRQAIQRMTLIGAAFSIPGVATQLLANTTDAGQGIHKDKLIRAFMDAVVPGADVEHPAATVMFRTRKYGFAKYRWLFVFDLRNRSRKLFGTGRFHTLQREERSSVIRDGLESRGKMKQLYSAAIQLSQVAIYTGFFRKPEQCTVIDFQAQFDAIETSFSDSGRFFGKQMTVAGNLP